MTPDPQIGEEQQRVIPEADVIHVCFRVNGGNRYIGVPPMASCNPSLGAVLSTRELQANFFANSSNPSMVLSTDKPMVPKQIAELKNSRRDATTGPNAGGTPVLSHGLKLIPGQQYVSAVDADLVSALRFSVSEVSRIYGIPMSLLSEQRDATYAASVEEARSLVYATLAPWTARIASAFSSKLLTPSARARGLSVEFNLTEMKLGDGRERAEFLRTMVSSGVMSLNEARNLSGLPDVAGGEELCLPLNSAPLSIWRTGEQTKRGNQNAQ